MYLRGKIMPLGMCLKYRLNIQFRKENADGFTTNSLALCKLALLTEVLILHSAEHVIDFKYLLN